MDVDTWPDHTSSMESIDRMYLFTSIITVDRETQRERGRVTNEEAMQIPQSNGPIK